MKNYLKIVFGLGIFIFGSGLTLADQASEKDRYFGGISERIENFIYDCVKKSKSDAQDSENCKNIAKQICETKFKNEGIKSYCKTQVNFNFLNASSHSFNLGNLRAAQPSKENPEGSGETKWTVFGLLDAIITLGASLVGIVMVAMFCYGGFLFVTSHGDENQIQKGKSVMVQSTIGGGITLGSYIIISLILGALFS